MNRFVDIKHLSKIFYGHGLFRNIKNTVTAVDDVSLGIAKNNTFGLVGESGCGKTSLVRAVLYLDPPTAGEVRIDDTLLGALDRSGLRAFRSRMQIVFQDPNSALNPKMTIRSSLEEGLINRGLDAPQRSRQIKKMTDLVGIASSHGKRYPHEFSGGQKQRIVIARALCMEPDFLVLDEPVSNLDVSIQAQIINLLQDLKTELGLTYLFISHDLNLVAYLSDCIAVMFQGRLVETGTSDEIMAGPLHPYTLKLFSSVPGVAGRILSERSDAPAEPLKSGREKASPTGSGCCYFDQCPMSGGACSVNKPQLKKVSGSHEVACYNVEAL